MKWYFLFFVVAITLVTCNPIETIDSEPVQIRVRNVSNFDFEEIVIWEENLGPLESLRNSDYFIKEPAYDKASISVKIDTFQFSMTVIDYVGEIPLRRGEYTFEVDLSDLTIQGYLTQNFVED